MVIYIQQIPYVKLLVSTHCTTGILHGFNCFRAQYAFWSLICCANSSTGLSDLSSSRTHAIAIMSSGLSLSSGAPRRLVWIAVITGSGGERLFDDCSMIHPKQ